MDKKKNRSALPLFLAAAVGVLIVAALLFPLGSRKTEQDGEPDQVLVSPQNERTRQFLSKVL